MCSLFILYALWLMTSSLVELCDQSYVDLISDHSYVDLVCCQSCVDLLLWYNLDYILFWHSFVCLFDLIVSLSKLYLHLVLVSIVHAYLLYVYFMACLLSLIQYIGEIPPNPKSAKMCMKFNFISICTFWCGVCPIYCSCLTTWTQLVWGPLCTWTLF
jgi:hypothetical protein